MKLHYLALIVPLCVAPCVGSAASVFEEVWGVATDPLKIRDGAKEVSATVDRVIVGLEMLQDEFDTDVRDYIKELNGIILLASQAVDSKIMQAQSAAFAIERKVFDDAKNLLKEGECALERFSKGTLPETLEVVLRQLSEGEISVDLPFGQNLELAIEAAKATSPDIAYIETRDAYLSSLNAVTDDTSAYVIVSAYQNIAEIAFKTHCHYEASGGGVLFLREFAVYSAKLKPWMNMVSVRVQR